MVVLRARRMVAEGAAIEVTVHFPGSAHAPVAVERDGSVVGWPDGLFSEGYREVLAIQREAQKQLANGGAVAMVKR